MLEHLSLGEETIARLQQAGIATYQDCTNLTLSQLESLNFNRLQAERLLRQCDEWARRRFRNEMLCAHLPEVCHWIEIETLELPPAIEERLTSRNIDYFYQLAYQRRPTVLRLLGISEKVHDFMVQKLEQFIQSYRRGQIVLEVEEE